MTNDNARTPRQELAVGKLAFDIVMKRVGVIMAKYPTRYYLRPPRGGCEWEAPPSELRPATTADLISPALAEVNTSSRHSV
ncbi:hypothetical protein [Streptomyces sp. NPDC048057]|uniref:hypothetical protein n=1 Tax=Streptomyces sp. NPDC048057 TaxID=3155628 RepID=UPI0033F98646